MIKEKTIIIKNIYYMLSYAFTNISMGEYINIQKEKFENIHNLFAAILAGGVAKQLKQGLYREYIGKVKEMTSLRGKLDMPGTIKNRIDRKLTLTCEFDELSENNLLNKILKSTMRLLLMQDDVEDKYKIALKKELMYFADIDNIDATKIRWSSVKFQRNNSSYILLIGICQLIIEGMLMTDEKGELKMASIIKEQEMERLYEKFILEYFKKEHPEINTSRSQIKWALDDDNNKLLPIMQTDVMLSKGDKTLIIDAKWYSHTTQEHFGKNTIHSQNIYQIFTYVKNKESEYGKIVPHEVAGMLLYAQTDDLIQPDIDYQMSGNKISVKTLDLNCDFPQIRSQLDKIANYFFA